MSFWEKIKSTPKETLLLYAAGVVILVLAVLMIYRDYEHTKQLNSLYEQLSTVQKYNQGNNPTTFNLGNHDADAKGISTAGDVSHNQADEFAKQVSSHESAANSGKSHNLYEYTVDTSADDTIRNIRREIATGEAPKEVRHANFVTTSTTDDGTVTKVDETTGQTTTVQQSTVKVNAYYNYQPSIYYATGVSPSALKRHDIIYTNRDIMLDVNYDADRNGNKFGFGIGYRIAKW